MSNFDDLHVLVVEDDDFQRRMLVTMLQSLGVASVCDADNGRRAIEVMRLSRDTLIDVVLTDLNMPEMDGLEFLRHLGEGNHGVSLVIISALGDKLLASAASMAKALNIKILDMLQKPITLEQLKDCFSRHVRTERSPPARATPMPNFSLEEIEKGVQAGQFQPYFQPKVDLHTGRLIGAEALARWIHPELGVVSPGAFVPQLEQSGKIDALTFQMIERSASAFRPLIEQGQNLTVAVNLSLTSLDDTALADRIARVVKQAGLDPRHMILEISETAGMSDIVRASENLARLCMRGFDLSIDDYGTGYSNIQQLVRIACSELKIDQSFVNGFTHNESLRIVVESSVEMAHRLGLRIVAEGVETLEDWDGLKQVGCDIAQGFFIAKPMALEAFNEFASENSH